MSLDTTDSRGENAVSTAQARTTAAHWRAMAAHRGQAVAVRTPDESITYAHLLAESDRRARAIAAAVDDARVPIAVEVESDVASVISVLAVLCTGHPVILLDPFLPDERRDHILRLSGARRLSPAEITELPDPGVEGPEPGPDDPSILIFTSGSTVKPKGVLYAQRAWVNQAVDGRDFLELAPQDRAAVLLPLSYGAGFECLVMTLLNGATMMLWDVRRRGTTDLRTWLVEQAATTVHSTPSLLRSWLADMTAAGAVDTVRLLSTCGEPVHSDDVATLRRTLMPAGVFCSWSGSSETGNLAFNRFPAQREVPSGVIPVGRPATDKHVRIVGEDGRDLPPGTVGEVVVESAHLALGYFNDPDQTAAKFTALGNGRRRYRTGDLGRFDDDGQLYLLGRRDDAIKVRGYLVEPAEVEAAIRALPWATDVVVTADRAAGRLTAHVAVDPDKWSPSPSEIRQALSASLAPWMIPRDVVVLAELPRNERGKVDRGALPRPPARVIEPMRGLTEANLEILWLDVLALDEVGRAEDFISLGGDSLAAAALLKQVSERWFVDISTAEFAREPTIVGLGRLLDNASRRRVRSEGAGAGTITLLRGGTGVPLFLVSGAGAPAVSLLPLVRELSGDYPVYGLQSHGLERKGRADHTIRAAARRVIADITEVAPHGPFRVGGYSFGGFVALEAAATLAGNGHDCEAVILIDPLFEPELVARIRSGAPRRRFSIARRSTVVRSTPDRSAAPDRFGDDTEPAGPRTLSERLTARWSKLLMGFLVTTAGLIRLPTVTHWSVFWDLSRRMIRRHRPAAYRGSAVLVASSSNTDDQADWEKLVGTLDVVRVTGDHHAMMRTPRVTEVAAAVNAVLEQFSGSDGRGR